MQQTSILTSRPPCCRRLGTRTSTSLSPTPSFKLAGNAWQLSIFLAFNISPPARCKLTVVALVAAQFAKGAAVGMGSSLLKFLPLGIGAVYAGGASYRTLASFACSVRALLEMRLGEGICVANDWEGANARTVRDNTDLVFEWA